MPPKSAGRRDWGHPEGLPLAEIDLDTEYAGVVTNVGNFGVFVDFGAVKDGLLRVPTKNGRSFRKGMEVKGLTVVSCDPDSGKVILRPEEGFGDAFPSAPSRASGRRRQPSKRRDWGHEDGKPLDKVEEGQLFDGIVTNVSVSGVFVDIGLAKDARLSVPARVGRGFRIGDSVPNCRVEDIDLARGRIAVSLDAGTDVRPKASKDSTTPSLKTKIDVSAKAQMDIVDLEVGSLVDGVVTNRGPFGVFVDIGCEKHARLQISKKLSHQFRRGDEVYGMKIENVDVENVRITVSLEDPELFGQEEGESGELEDARPPLHKKRVVSPKPLAPRPTVAAKAKPKLQGRTVPLDHPDGVPVSRFRAGDTADGVVTRIGASVFVNIGAVCDGVLKLSREIAQQFQAGDEVHGMVIEAVDVEATKIILSLEDPELEAPALAKPKTRPTRDKVGARSPVTRAVGNEGPSRCKVAARETGDDVVHIDEGNGFSKMRSGKAGTVRPPAKSRSRPRSR